MMTIRINLLKALLTASMALAVSICFAQEDAYTSGLKAFDAQDYERAAVLLRPYADAGNCLAQYAVGFSYSNENIAAANDSIAEVYLTKAANQKQTHAMGLLAVLYFKMGYSDSSYNVQALAWAELAAAYDPIQRGTTTRYMLRQYMKPEEIAEAEKLVKKRKAEFDKLQPCA